MFATVSPFSSVSEGEKRFGQFASSRRNILRRSVTVIVGRARSPDVTRLRRVRSSLNISCSCLVLDFAVDDVSLLCSLELWKIQAKRRWPQFQSTNQSTTYVNKSLHTACQHIRSTVRVNKSGHTNCRQISRHSRPKQFGQIMYTTYCESVVLLTIIRRPRKKEIIHEAQEAHE